MKKLCRLGCIVALVASMGLTSCHNYTPRKQEAKSNVVRIYDVEPQDRSNMQVSTYDRYMKMLSKIDTNELNEDEQEKNKKEVEAMQEVLFTRHEFRMGVSTATDIQYTYSKAVEKDIPFEEGLNTISEETEIDIDYIMLGSWEEVRSDIEKHEDDSITKIILFNNSYDESLIREAVSGKYVNMSEVLKELGLYDEERYDQAVLKAGVIDGNQYLVPILYNVSGMLQGEWEEHEQWQEEIQKGIYEPTTAQDIETGGMTFEAFMEKINTEMHNWDTSSNGPLFLSAGLYEDEPDLFLLASGIEWEEYKNQYLEFSLLLDYMKTYQKTQVDSQYGVSLQEKYISFLKEIEHFSSKDAYAIESRLIEELKRELEYTDPDSVGATLLRETDFFVESTSAEETAFHSIVGLLSYYGVYMYGGQGFYTRTGQDILSGMCNYWPIGITGDKEVYAAQPLCYAAVLEGGDSKMAGEIIQRLLEHPWAAECGISPCIETRTEQIDSWAGAYRVEPSMRNINKTTDGTYEEEHIRSKWADVIQFQENVVREVFTEQLRSHVANVVTAEIPDRELLAIWRNTLTEAVEDELSAEEGFEILCQRMDEWYGK